MLTLALYRRSLRQQIKQSNISSVRLYHRHLRFWWLVCKTWFVKLLRISEKVGGWGSGNMKKVRVLSIDVTENPCRLSNWLKRRQERMMPTLHNHSCSFMATASLQSLRVAWRIPYAANIRIKDDRLDATNSLKWWENTGLLGNCTRCWYLADNRGTLPA